MPRPTTKPDLTKAANEQFDKMWQHINSMTDDEQNAAFNFGEDIKQKEAHWKRDKNMRDVLVHLYEWHQLLLNWITANQNGEAKPFLLAPYNWKTYGDMNVMFWEKHQYTTYNDSKVMLLDSHKKVMSLLESFSNEELFQSKHFSWTGTTTLGSYCVSVTASHYDWAIKKIKAHKKSYKE
ncbi:MAG: ClbS/DfsB family four-helix bundle protein [Oscillospiraceae bacterium]|nr:ClbS/DfsB family four-helix bundle protein [Oscillospiraceae bacterium]